MKNATGVISLLFLAGVMGAAVAEEAASLEAAYQMEVKGQYKEAIGGYEAVLKTIGLREKWPQATFREIECLIKLQQFKKATEDCEKLAKDYPNEPLASEALWRAVTLQSGPLNNRNEAIRVAQILHRQYPRTEFGERGAYSEAVLHYWNDNLPKAKDALNRYLQEYRDGKYAQASKDLLAKMESGK